MKTNYGSWLIIGRTSGEKGGHEFRWRPDDDDECPSGTDLSALNTQMCEVHRQTFDELPSESRVVALPAWSDEKLYKHPSWRDGAEAGRHGLHVDDRAEF